MEIYLVIKGGKGKRGGQKTKIWCYFQDITGMVMVGVCGEGTKIRKIGVIGGYALLYSIK